MLHTLRPCVHAAFRQSWAMAC